MKARNLILGGMLVLSGFVHSASSADLKGTHLEVDPIRIQLGSGGELITLAMDRDGNLLAGVMWYANGNKNDKRYGVKKLSPTGALLQTWVLKGQFKPKMIHGCDDGTVFVGGYGFLASFDAKGKELARIDVDVKLGYKAITAGLYANEKYVFVAYGEGRSLRATEEIYRFNRDLSGMIKIIDRQYGCCGHIDLEVVAGRLIVAENSRHRVNVFDYNGKKLSSWGSRDRTGIEGFAACCNPCNTDIAKDGTIYTFESGVGRVKRYSSTGKYLGFVGFVDTTKFDRGSRVAAQSCYIPGEVSPDGRRIYVMDVRQHFIRVLEQVRTR